MPKQIPAPAKAFSDRYSPKKHLFYEALKASGVKFNVIAEALGVSPSKLSKVLRGFEIAPPDLETRLEALTKQLSPSNPARSDESPRSNDDLRGMCEGERGDSCLNQ